MNFKYELGQSTNKGIIRKRYYAEWTNRNGGFCCGDFYVMENEKSYNESFLEEILHCSKCNSTNVDILESMPAQEYCNDCGYQRVIEE